MPWLRRRIRPVGVRPSSHARESGPARRRFRGGCRLGGRSAGNRRDRPARLARRVGSWLRRELEDRGRGGPRVDAGKELHSHAEHVEDRRAELLADALADLGSRDRAKAHHIALVGETEGEHLTVERGDRRGGDDRPRPATGRLLQRLQHLGPCVAQLGETDATRTVGGGIGRRRLGGGLGRRRDRRFDGRHLCRGGRRAGRGARGAAGGVGAASMPIRRSRRSTRARAPRSESSAAGTRSRATMSSR